MIRKAYVTLDELKKWGACRKGYRRLLRSIEYDKSWDEVMVPLALIYDLNSDDGWWVLTTLDDYGLLTEKTCRKWFETEPFSDDERRFVSRLVRNTKTGKVFLR